MIVIAVVDESLSPDFPLGADLEIFVRREDAERLIEEVCGRRRDGVLPDGREALVTSRVEAEPDPLAGLLGVVIAPSRLEADEALP